MNMSHTERRCWFDDTRSRSSRSNTIVRFIRFASKTIWFFLILFSIAFSRPFEPAWTSGVGRNFDNLQVYINAIALCTCNLKSFFGAVDFLLADKRFCDVDLLNSSFLLSTVLVVLSSFLLSRLVDMRKLFARLNKSMFGILHRSIYHQMYISHVL